MSKTINFTEEAHVAGTAVKRLSTSQMVWNYPWCLLEAQLMFSACFLRHQRRSSSNFIYTKAGRIAGQVGADSRNEFGNNLEAVYDVGDHPPGLWYSKKGAGSNHYSPPPPIWRPMASWHSSHLPPTPDYRCEGRLCQLNVIFSCVNSLTKHESTSNLTVETLKVRKTSDGKIPMHSFVRRDAFRTTIPQSYLHVEEREDSTTTKQIVSIAHLVLTDEAAKFRMWIRSELQSWSYRYVFLPNGGTGEVILFWLEGFWGTIPSWGYWPRCWTCLAQHANDYQLHIANKFKRVPYDAANQLSDFSSWGGLSADGISNRMSPFQENDLLIWLNNGEYYMDREPAWPPHAAGHYTGETSFEGTFSLISSPEQLQVLVKQMTMVQRPQVDERKRMPIPLFVSRGRVMDVTTAALNLISMLKDAKSNWHLEMSQIPLNLMWPSTIFPIKEVCPT